MKLQVTQEVLHELTNRYFRDEDISNLSAEEFANLYVDTWVEIKCAMLNHGRCPKE